MRLDNFSLYIFGIFNFVEVLVEKLEVLFAVVCCCGSYDLFIKIFFEIKSLHRFVALPFCFFFLFFVVVALTTTCLFSTLEGGGWRALLILIIRYYHDRRFKFRDN
jgi:hypothetical protein